MGVYPVSTRVWRGRQPGAYVQLFGQVRKSFASNTPQRASIRTSLQRLPASPAFFGINCMLCRYSEHVQAGFSGVREVERRGGFGACDRWERGAKEGDCHTLCAPSNGAPDMALP